MKINRLEIENVKRVRAVRMEPTESGLTVIGGNNNQGKTSVLDSIAWALGGNSFKPSEAARHDSAAPPYIKVVMSNGLVVERKGKNSELKVTDPSGQKAGQQLLDSFVEKLALDLPKFMEASDKEKAEILLAVIGVGGMLAELEKKEKDLYQERLVTGRIADQKKKFADEQTYYSDAPKDLISPSELIRQQQEILTRNGEKARIRADAVGAEEREKMALEKLSLAQAALNDAQERLNKAMEAYNKAAEEKEIAFGLAEDAGEDEPTDELEASIRNIDEINRKVRANLDKDKAEEDAKTYTDKYGELSVQIEQVRKEKTALLDNAPLPLPGLSVSEGKLIYKGQQWDNMSGSDRLKVSAAIVRKLRPECQFVLMDKLEQMDMETLKEFDEWLKAEGLQVIATRVSTGGECSIIIEDGYAVAAEKPKEAPKPLKKWDGGF